MSNAVSALQGKVYEGFTRVADAGPRGMITLRGDLSSKAVRDAATGVAGADFPDVNRATGAGDRAICWMSPDEVLVLCPL